MDAFYKTHVSSLPSTLCHTNLLRPNLLLPERQDAPLTRCNRPRRHDRGLKLDRFLKFTVDDGTGCIPCILWLNQLSSPDFFRRSAAQIQLGVVARVRGRITAYRGSVLCTFADVVIERDLNVEILRWLDCVNVGVKLPSQKLNPS